MDKKSKDPLRHYKKSSRHATHSSSESSSSDSDTGSSSSYSSTDSEHNRISERHRKKKSSRRANSSSGDDRRKRDKRDHLQKKLEAKRNHLKRKLKEAKLKKRAAAAAAALSGHGHRALSPATQAKLKKLAERKHLRAASKEGREREREKLRAVQRDRERDHHRLGSRSPPTKSTKIRIHQDVKRQKSPGISSGGGGGASSSSTSRMHHQLMSREKIIIQTRTRDRTPSIERDRDRGDRPRHDHKQRHDELSLRDRDRRDRERERAEREAARDKERAEALARCQERQRERERLARAKMRREEEEKKYGESTSGSGTGRLRQLSERNLEISGSFSSRERSIDAAERSRHINKRELDPYDRDPEYIVEPERHGVIDDIRRYGGAGHRQRELSPLAEHYPTRIREPREIYPEEERDHLYKRGYPMEVRYTSRERESWLDSRDLRDHELHDSREFRDTEEVLYTDERERVLRERERTSTLARNDWKTEWDRNEWDESGGTTPGRAGGFVGGPKRVMTKPQPSSLQQQGHQRADSESNWDTDEQDACLNLKPEPNWMDHEQREKPRTWQSNDWRDADDGFIGGSGGVRGGPEGGHLAHQPSPTSHHPSPTSHHPSPTSHHLHPRSDRGRGFRRGGAHGDHMNERGSQSYRPHPPPLMTLPVQPPGGYHGVSNSGSGSTRGFPHKRLTYTNPGYGKKHTPHMVQQRYSPQPSAPVKTVTSATSTSSSSAAQASAVVAATTAVAAAKAAAQSTANAITNPGILGQVSKVATTSNSGSNNYSNDTDGASTKTGDTHDIGSGMGIGIDDKQSEELSEISDSDDDILNKTDKVKPKSDELVDGAETLDSPTDAISNEESQSTTKPESTVGAVASTCADKTEDDEVLDFEEISDGELEEDARHKGIGDALGVDWQGLIAETRAQANEYAATQEAAHGETGKQSWQAHRILLDVGVSLRMAGISYGQQLISEARAQLQMDRDEKCIKRVIKQEPGSQTPKEKYRSSQQSPPPIKDIKIESPATATLACVQVAKRSETNERQEMVNKICGSNSRALSARQDLKLRRHLSDLPSRDCHTYPKGLPKVSQKLQKLAVNIFQQRAMNVK